MPIDDSESAPEGNPENITSEHPVCPLCRNPIHDLVCAITHQETKTPAHFDCILKALREVEEIHKDEIICYLGNGSFGIIQVRNPQSPVKFFLRKRIQYEHSDDGDEWRNIIYRKLIQSHNIF